MRIIAIIIALALLLPQAAHAEKKILQSGMHHIVVKKPDAPEKPDVQPVQQTESAEQTDSKQTDKEKEIWKKYRELANGTAKPAETNTSETDPTEKTTPQQAAATSGETAPPTGIAGIIAQYHRNKKQQSEMKTLRFTSPEIKTAPDNKAKAATKE
jgi:hypothetical protein